MNNCLKLKGGMTTVVNIVVQAKNLKKIEEEIYALQSKAPSLMKGMPIVIDFGSIEVTSDFVSDLISLIKSVGSIPFGIKGEEENLADIARLSSLAYLGLGHNAIAQTTASKNDDGLSIYSENTKASPTEPESSIERAKIVHGPIRGGQQVYARNADLIIMGNVNNSAEVLADGNVHIYGTLKGRVLAGLRGDDHSKIFVSNFDPEMILINGDYMTKGDISQDLIGQSVVIFKVDEKININKVSS